MSTRDNQSHSHHPQTETEEESAFVEICMSLKLAESQMLTTTIDIILTGLSQYISAEHITIICVLVFLIGICISLKYT